MTAMTLALAYLWISRAPNERFGCHFAVTLNAFLFSTRRALRKRLDPLAVRRSTVAGLAVRSAVWTRPELRAEMNYRGLTATGELRHASFRVLRATCRDGLRPIAQGQSLEHPRRKRPKYRCCASSAA